MAAAGKKEYSLGYIIGAQLKSSFPDAFKKVERQLLASKKAVNNAKAAWKNFGTEAGKIALGIVGTVTAATVAVYKLVDSVADQGDRAAKTAERLKMPIDAYQELEYAFRSAGLGGDEFVSIMNKLDSTLVRAASSEKEAARWAEEFGLCAEKLARMSPEQRIERLADYLNSLEDPLERDRLAMELFGKSGAEMARILDMGSDGIKQLRDEARRTGNIMSLEAARQAEAYKDVKQELTATISGIKIQLFSRLLPVFAESFKAIAARLQGVDWSAWGDKIAGWVNGAIPKIKEIAVSTGEFIGKIRSGIQTVKAFVGGWDKVALIAASLLTMKTAISGVTAVINTVIAAKKIWLLVQKALNLVLIKNPIGLIIIAIAGLRGKALFLCYSTYPKICF